MYVFNIFLGTNDEYALKAENLIIEHFPNSPQLNVDDKKVCISFKML